jgi:hypothetical protein
MADWKGFSRLPFGYDSISQEGKYQWDDSWTGCEQSVCHRDDNKKDSKA